MTWLPSELGANVRFVFGTRPGPAQQSLAALGAAVITPLDLTDKERAAITRNVMAQASKTRIAAVLSNAQVMLM